MAQDPARRRYRRFFGTDPRRDVDEELSFHLAMRADEYRAEGLSADDAMARARSRFGDVDQIHRECDVLSSARASRVERARRLEALRHDVVAAARALRGDRAFALGVAMTLALGIGATAAVFSVAYGVLLRPLPFPHAEQLVRLWSRKAARNLDFFSVSPADFKSWRSEGGGFAAMSAFERQRSAALGRGDGTEVIQISAVTADIFPLLGTRPILGRSLIADDARPDAPAVAVIGYAVWASRFGADSALVGGAISLDGRPVRVVGVMPPRFFVPGSGAELWLPLSLDSASVDHANRYLRVLGRLAPGTTLEQAVRRLDVVAARLAVAYPGTNQGWTVNAQSVPEMVVGTQVRRALAVLAGVVAFVLLIACANAANLQLARTAARRREIALRIALGASRGRIAAQLLAESVLIALAAGGVGLALAAGGLRLLRVWAGDMVPRLDEVRLDAPAVLFILAVALGSGVLFGLLPALRAARGDAGELLKTGARAAGVAGDNIRGALVVVEVALSLVLLVGAGLLIRSFLRLQRVDVGFDPKGLSVAAYSLPANAYPEPDRLARFMTEALDRVRSLPGVSAAGAVSGAPFAAANSGLVFVPVDHPVAERERAPDADYRVITPGYLRAMEIPLLRGRDFDASDRAGAPDVALISDFTARRFWPGQDPLGRRIRINDVKNGRELTIVAIVGDARYQSLETTETRAMIYLSALQRPERSMMLVVRGPATAKLSASIRRTFASMNRALPPPTVRDMSELLDIATASRRFALLLFSVFAGVALLLAIVGVYALMSYLVRERTRELGIRIALGASREAVVALVVGRALRLAILGVAIGIAGAWMLTRTLGALLFAVSAHDPLTFAGIAVALVSATLMASVLPARRATRADPMQALRTE